MKSNLSRRRRSQAGFTLAEMAIALGVTAVIALSSGQVITMLTRSSGNMDSKLGQLKLQKDILRALAKPATCAAALQSRDFNATGNTPVTLKLDNDIVVGADPNHRAATAYGVQINRLDFVAPRLVGTATNSVYSAQLVLESQALKGGNHVPFASVPIGLVRLQVAGGQVTDCFSLEQTEDISQVGCDQLAGAMLDGVCRLTPDMAPVSCPANEYLQGFSTTGSKVCKPLSGSPGGTPPGNCPVLPFSSPVEFHYPGQRGAGSVSVPVTVTPPPGCRMDSIDVSYRQFGAWSGSCQAPGHNTLSSRAPDSAWTWTRNGKGYSWSGHWDQGGNVIIMTVNSFGWGPSGGACGGNPCNACLSDLQFLVHTVPQ